MYFFIFFFLLIRIAISSRLLNKSILSFFIFYYDWKFALKVFRLSLRSNIKTYFARLKLSSERCVNLFHAVEFSRNAIERLHSLHRIRAMRCSDSCWRYDSVPHILHNSSWSFEFHDCFVSTFTSLTRSYFLKALVAKRLRESWNLFQS